MNSNGAKCFANSECVIAAHERAVKVGSVRDADLRSKRELTAPEATRDALDITRHT